VVNFKHQYLDHIYRDGRHYDHFHKDFVSDIPFWIKQAQMCGGPILELACGTGRITIPIASKNFEVTGLDLSETMLAQARKKGLNEKVDVEWIHADCRNFHLNKLFGLVIFPFNSMSHLHTLDDIEPCLLSVHKHLKPEGRFIIDVFNPYLSLLTRDASKRYPLTTYDDPDGNGAVEITESNIYDDSAQINRITMYYKVGDLEERADELNMRIFFPQEVDAILKYNGFTIENKFGDFKENPFEPGSPKQIIISRKA